MVTKIPVPVRDLGPVFVVAVAVALLSTLVGAVVDHVHQVDAEALASQQFTAQATSATQQTLALNDWGLQATFPLAPEMPLVVAASHGTSSLGLSSVALAKYGPACAADRNALGSLSRYPKGAAVQEHGGAISYVVAEIGDYKYVYQMPNGACSQSGSAPALTTQQTSVLREYLGGLATIAP